MRRNLLFIIVVCLALTSPFPRAADDLEIRGLGEIQVFYNDAELNRLDGGFSTTRFDEGSFLVQLAELGVNLAARLESATKDFGVPIIVSEARKALAPGFGYTALDTIQVKGKQQVVRIYSPSVTET